MHSSYLAKDSFPGAVLGGGVNIWGGVTDQISTFDLIMYGYRDTNDEGLGSLDPKNDCTEPPLNQPQ